VGGGEESIGEDYSSRMGGGDGRPTMIVKGVRVKARNLSVTRRLILAPTNPVATRGKKRKITNVVVVGGRVARKCTGVPERNKVIMGEGTRRVKKERSARFWGGSSETRDRGVKKKEQTLRDSGGSNNCIPLGGGADQQRAMLRPGGEGEKEPSIDHAEFAKVKRRTGRGR